MGAAGSDDAAPIRRRSRASRTALSATMAAQVELHFADCDDCRTLVFALASGGKAPAPVTRELSSVEPDTPVFEVAETRWALARALWSDANARPRARTLAEQARDGFVAAADAGAKPLVEVNAWLEAH